MPCNVELVSGAMVSLGVAICFDLEFPEPSRCLAVQGAEVLVAPTAVDELATTPRFIPARAMENQMFVLHANPEGRAPPSLPYDTFSGGSGIYSPDGKALVAAGDYTGGTLLTSTIVLDDDQASSCRISLRAPVASGEQPFRRYATMHHRMEPSPHRRPGVSLAVGETSARKRAVLLVLRQHRAGHEKTQESLKPRTTRQRSSIISEGHRTETKNALATAARVWSSGLGSGLGGGLRRAPRKSMASVQDCVQL